MSMDDTSQQSLQDDSSFSHGWTLSKPFVDFLGDSRRSFDTLDAASFIEMDPHFLSRRWTIAGAGGDFDFDVPRLSISGPVLADHISSRGHLAPCPPTDPSEADIARSTLRTLLDESRRRQAGSCLDSAARRSASSENSSPLVFHSARSTPSAASSSLSLSRRASMGGARKELKSPSVNNFMKSPRKMLLKYLCFLIPMYKKLLKGFRIKISSRSEICRSSGAASTRSSPRTSSAFSSIQWCRNNADISIAEAILYCKKSNGQYNMQCMEL